MNNNILQSENCNKIIKEKKNINHSQLEKDICVLINYIRTNPLDFSKNIKHNENEENLEIIHFLENTYNKEMLVPFEEIPEISEAARNLLINIALNDKKFHNINLQNIKPETLNLRTRLSNYGHRTGRIFETVIFKTEKPEDIVNHILIDENGRNMLLSNKMKYMGVACDILPSNIICSVIDIVQDFTPYRKNIDSYNSVREDYINYNLKEKYKNIKGNGSIINDLNYDNNIDNLKLKLDVREKDINISGNNLKNSQNMNIIINNDNDNEDYIPDLFVDKHTNQRKNFIYVQKKEFYKTPKKMNSMEIPNENEKYFSPKSINSYNIIINNKIIPTKNKLNNINLVKKNNNFKDDENNIFTMAGRTCKEQQEVIEIYSKNYINKSRSVCSMDFNINNPMNTKNKFQRLNTQEKLEILHKINQRNKDAKSSNNKKHENIKNFDNVYSKKSSYNFDNNYEENRKNISSYYAGGKNYYFNFDLDRNNDCFSSNRLNTCMSKINDSSKFSNICKSPSLYDSKSNLEINDDYTKSKINKNKNDLLLFKNQIKKELKDEVKNEIRDEIKIELNISNSKRSPSSTNLEQYNDNNIINSKRKDENVQIKNNSKKKIDEEIYHKKSSKNYFMKNKMINRCSSEEKFINKKDNINENVDDKKERKSFNPKMYVKKKNNEEKNIKDKYRENYENLNELPKNTINYNNISINQGNNNININKNISNEYKNTSSYFNDGHRAKNRQQIKKLIRLYNLAKDSKKTQSTNFNDNICDIINNNKSISNLFYDNNNNNNCNNEAAENITERDNNNQNKKKDNNSINKNGKKKIIKNYIFHKKYERVKPIGNFYKSGKNSNSNYNSKNEINNNNNKINKKEKNLDKEPKEIDENHQEKEKINKNSINKNSINEIIPNSQNVEDNSNNNNKAINNNDHINSEISIKSYAEKNQINNIIYKREIKKNIIPRVTISIDEKKNIINSIDNEGKRLEKVKIKSPNQTAKIFYNKKSNFINNNISKISKSNSLYKDKNKYKSFPFNYKKTNTNIDSKDNNNNN